MTTRGAARAASTNTSPAAPSVANPDSRRNSLNSVVANYPLANRPAEEKEQEVEEQEEQEEQEDERPAKRNRVSTESGPPPDRMRAFTSQLRVAETDDGPASSQTRPVSDSSPNSQNRKRRASRDSTGTSNTGAAVPDGLVARSESDLSDMAPRRKKRKTNNGTSPEPSNDGPQIGRASCRERVF